MAMEPPETTMQCAQCGKLFTGNPRSQPLGRDNYCSVSCEEGRTARPMSDPQSPDYHLHLQGNPESLVGRAIVVRGLKRTCYSPEWHRAPEEYGMDEVVYHDEENEVLVVKSSLLLGEVYDLRDGEYHIEKENMETGEVRQFTVRASVAVDRIEAGRWWAE